MVVLNRQRHGEVLVSMASDDTGRDADIPALLLGPRDSDRLLAALGALAAGGGGDVGHRRGAAVTRGSEPGDWLELVGGGKDGGGGLMGAMALLPTRMMPPGHPALRAIAAARAAAAEAAEAGKSEGAVEAGAGGDGEQEGGAGGGGDVVGTRLDLLVPSGSTPFLQANVLGKGGTLQKLFEQLLADGRAVLLLQQAVQGAARETVRAAKAGQQGQGQP